MAILTAETFGVSPDFAVEAAVRRVVACVNVPAYVALAFRASFVADVASA